MKLNEIDATMGVEPLTISMLSLIRHSNHIDNFEGRDVYLFSDENKLVYMFQSNAGVDAFVSFDLDYNLTGIKNNTNTGGLVTTLIGFVTHKLKHPVKIPHTEQLTPDGIKWLCSLVRNNGRGLTITDQTGKLPDSDLLKKEWETALRSSDPGPTSILIESHMTRQFLSKEERSKKLMSYTFWIGDIDLL